MSLNVNSQQNLFLSSCLLKKVNYDYEMDLQVIYNKNSENPDAKFGYDPLLNVYRNKIDNIDSDVWKKVRWFINDYDFQVRDPIINRAFYKYWEIINEFEIFEDYNDNELILHCAEAPGGFIQGTNIYLQVERRMERYKQIKRDNIVDEDGFRLVNKRKTLKNDYLIYSISLNKDLPQYKTYNLPTYNKNVINKNICITYGVDNTGDINNVNNIRHIKRLSKRNFFLITADGGFDEGTDFNNKEQLHYMLILSEITSAIHLQQQDGHFILKMFDIFTETSIQLIYLLNKCYREVYIYKPKTSRPTNSEKYIICKYFMLDESIREEYMSKLVLNKKNNTNNMYMSFKLFDKIPDEFIANIRELNSNLVNNQCEYLNAAIQLCTNDDFLKQYDDMVDELMVKRKIIFHDWEETYNLNAYV